MIEDREIWACANLLLKRHGSHAWFVAARRADELLSNGEMEGHRTFMRILRRIGDLENMAPEGGLQ